jgi:hypothetical protein
MDVSVSEALKVGPAAAVAEAAKKNPGKIPGFFFDYVYEVRI